MTTYYSVHVLYENGQGAYLDVKGRHQWKDKRRARYHAQGLLKAWPDVVDVSIENEFLETIEVVCQRD